MNNRDIFTTLSNFFTKNIQTNQLNSIHSWEGAAGLQKNKKTFIISKFSIDKEKRREKDSKKLEKMRKKNRLT